MRVMRLRWWGVVAAAAFVVFVAGVGWKWQVADSGTVLYESETGYASEADAAAAGAATLGSEWPGSEVDQTWHYVGESGEPAFGSGWANVTGLSKLAFRAREAGVVDIHGVIEPGIFGGVIFTIPAEYRPTEVAWFVAAGIDGSDNGHVAVFAVNAAGDVIVTADASVVRVIVSGQYFLDPPVAAS